MSPLTLLILIQKPALVLKIRKEKKSLGLVFVPFSPKCCDLLGILESSKHKRALNSDASTCSRYLSAHYRSSALVLTGYSLMVQNTKPTRGTTVKSFELISVTIAHFVCRAVSFP